MFTASPFSISSFAVGFGRGLKPKWNSILVCFLVWKRWFFCLFHDSSSNIQNGTYYILRQINQAFAAETLFFNRYWVGRITKTFFSFPTLLFCRYANLHAKQDAYRGRATQKYNPNPSQLIRPRSLNVLHFMAGALYRRIDRFPLRPIKLPISYKLCFLQLIKSGA